MNNFKNKSLGIIGGAGPMAGVLLCEYIIQECQQNYSCTKDDDFPKFMLLSVPFALDYKLKNNHGLVIVDQLKDAVETLQPLSNYMGIACNTLHGFIDVNKYPSLISIINVTKDYLQEKSLKTPLVLCTTTSASKRIHHFENAVYPDKQDQQKMDRIIELVSAGDDSCATKKLLEEVIESCIAKNDNIDAVILGCTELSVLVRYESVNHLAYCVDPLKVLAKIFCDTLFSQS